MKFSFLSSQIMYLFRRNFVRSIKQQEEKLYLGDFKNKV